MRDIKFRGKDIKGNWRYGDLMTMEHFVADSKGKYEIGDFEKSLVYKIIPETIGQYTGLHDKNGKEIYEGDIVKVLINGIWYIGQVIYEHSGFTIDVTNNKQLEFGRRGIIEKFTEVIGNIYDNPDLLKGE